MVVTRDCHGHVHNVGVFQVRFSLGDLLGRRDRLLLQHHSVTTSYCLNLAENVFHGQGSARHDHHCHHPLDPSRLRSRLNILTMREQLGHGFVQTINLGRFACSNGCVHRLLGQVLCLTRIGRTRVRVIEAFNVRAGGPMAGGVNSKVSSWCNPFLVRKG